jgi:hypothetical protein
MIAHSVFKRPVLSCDAAVYYKMNTILSTVLLNFEKIYYFNTHFNVLPYILLISDDIKMDHFPDNRDYRGSFRLGLNRRMEMELDKELGDVMKKTIREVSAVKTLNKNQPGSEEEQLVQ